MVRTGRLYVVVVQRLTLAGQGGHSSFSKQINVKSGASL